MSNQAGRTVIEQSLGFMTQNQVVSANGDLTPICPVPLRYTVIPSGKNREKKTRRNGYSRGVSI